MKRIINGKLYKTQTAEMIAETEANCSKIDFKYYKETLYRKKTGEFFLNGEGHAMTKYAQHFDSCWGYGYKTIPLTLDEAKE